MGAILPESAAEQLGTVLCAGAENRLQALQTLQAGG